VTLPEEAAGDFQKWFDGFVIQGNSGQENEKGGTLEYLTPDLKAVLFKLTFKNLGIFKVVPEEAEAKSCDCDLCQTVVDGANSARRRRFVAAHLYCEGMEFQFIDPPEPE
jgi:hypothetical protein